MVDTEFLTSGNVYWSQFSVKKLRLFKWSLTVLLVLLTLAALSAILNLKKKL